MKTITISIDGDDQTFDLEALLTVANPEMERNTVAVELAYWGGIWAAKLEEEEMADADYHHWRGETICDLLKKEEKAAEWKVKEFVNGSEGYLEVRRVWGKAKRDVQGAKAMFEAYSRKADILARLIAREDTERVRSGDVGRTSDGAKTPAADKIAAAKAAIEKTRAGRTTT